jgi:hypothetical protein
MADMDFWQLLNIINEQFPQLVPILKKPGIFKVLADSINGNWSADKRNAELAKTPYYTSTPVEQRQWDILSATDPATAGEKARLVVQQVKDLEAQTGIRFTNDQLGFAFMVNAVKLGWDAQTIKYQLLASVNTRGGTGGEIGSSATLVKSMANDYGVSQSDAAVMNWAKQLASGAVDQNGVKGYLIEQAKSRFPGLSDALDRGVTVRQYADQYLQIAQQELGVDPATASLTDPKWSAALDQVDPKTGTHFAMTQADWTRKIRQDPTYGYNATPQAAQQAATLTTQIAQKMGAI